MKINTKLKENVIKLLYKLINNLFISIILRQKYAYIY